MLTCGDAVAALERRHTDCYADVDAVPVQTLQPAVQGRGQIEAVSWSRVLCMRGYYNPRSVAAASLKQLL